MTRGNQSPEKLLHPFLVVRAEIPYTFEYKVWRKWKKLFWLFFQNTKKPLTHTLRITTAEEGGELCGIFRRSRRWEKVVHEHRNGVGIFCFMDGLLTAKTSLVLLTELSTLHCDCQSVCECVRGTCRFFPSLSWSYFTKYLYTFTPWTG